MLDHLAPLPSPVGLADSSVGLPGFSSSSSPLVFGAIAVLFFLKVDGTMSAGRPISISINHAVWRIKLTEFLDEECNSLVVDGEVGPLPAEDILDVTL